MVKFPEKDYVIESLKNTYGGFDKNTLKKRCRRLQTI